jgi:hypothetical protein
MPAQRNVRFIPRHRDTPLDDAKVAGAIARELEEDVDAAAKASHHVARVMEAQAQAAARPKND